MQTSTTGFVFRGARIVRLFLTICFLAVLLVSPLRAPAAACGTSVVLANADPAAVEKYQAALQAAHAGDFRAQIDLANMYRRGEGVAPDWGRAEVLASLGEVYLELGQLREARDLIEQSLLEAPEYHVALKLRNALSLQR